jgi:hypothetical protein
MNGELIQESQGPRADLEPKGSKGLASSRACLWILFLLIVAYPLSKQNYHILRSRGDLLFAGGVLIATNRLLYLFARQDA